MNKVYTHARRAFMRGEVDVTADTFGAYLGASDLSDESYEFVSHIAPGSVLGDPATLTNVALDASEPWFTADDITFAEVPVGGAYGLVIYLDTGVAATSRLLAWLDRRGDTTPLQATTNGGDVTIRFASNRLFRL